MSNDPPPYRPFGDQYGEPDSRQDDHDRMDATYGAQATGSIVVKIGDVEYHTGAFVTGLPGTEPDAWVGIVGAIVDMVVSDSDDPEEARDNLRSFAV